MGYYCLLSCAVLLNMCLVTAGSDVILYNQQEIDRDNLDDVFGEEEFLSMPTYNRKTPLRSKSPSSNLPQKDNNPLVMSRDSKQKQSNLSFGSKLQNSDNDLSLKSVSSNSKNSSNISQNQRTKPLVWYPWQEEIEENEIEDEYLVMDTMLRPDPSDEFSLLSRHRRDTQTSGDVGAPFNMVVNGLTLPASKRVEITEEITAEIKSKLETNIPGSTFEVATTSIVQDGDDVNVEGEITYQAEETTRTQIAQVLYDIDIADNFPIDGATYAISDTELQAESTVTQRPSICFLCETYQTCYEVSEIWYCKISDSRFYDFGNGVNDNTLARDDELVSARVNLDTKMSFNKELVDSAYISANGVISFESEFASFAPKPLPVDGYKLLCPYWTDLDIPLNDRANVWHQLYLKESANETLMQRANADIVQYNGEGLTSFDATSVLVVTWEEAQPHIPMTDLERVNFQTVVISDGQSTYAMFMYLNGGMKFDATVERKLEVGWGSTNLDLIENYYVFDQVLGNTDETGRWFFKIGDVPNSRALCTQFLAQQTVILAAISQYNNIVPACPCSEINARISPLWVPNFVDNDVTCYDVLPLYQAFGRRCCYTKDESFETRRPLAGNLQLFTPLYGRLDQYDLNDKQPKRWCCEESDLCEEFYNVRPVRPCADRSCRNALMFGDPHVTTLDQREFIFNGLGEYTLLEIEGTVPSTNEYVNFTMQARTCVAQDSAGNPTQATVFCALAMRNTNGTTVHIQVDLVNSDYFVVYVNGQDYSYRFRNTTDFRVLNNNIFFQNINGSLAISTPDNIGATVSLNLGLFDISPAVGLEYKSMTKGLLGNFNEDNKDDFIQPDGTQVANDATERELFNYGELWAITPAQSIFFYYPGFTPEDFRNASFLPIFLDEADPAVKQAAEVVCGNTSLACVFDYIATNNQQLAINTKDAAQNFEVIEVQLDNKAPVVDDAVTVKAVVNQEANFTVTATDPESSPLTYVIVQAPGSAEFTSNIQNSNTFVGSFTPSDTNPVSIELAAVDDKNLQTEIQVNVIVCTGCTNGQGECDYNNTVTTNNTYYQVATCVCDAPYVGDECEDDKDGCANRPCPVETNCTDATIAEELANGVAYTCSACPDGLVLSNITNKCIDVNECDDIESNCPNNSTCTNSLGSYSCECISGFRNTRDKTVCDDIDECIEQLYDCAQICENTVGGYTCSCNPGFVSSGTFGYNCTAVASEDPCASITNSCEYGCLDDNGKAKCFCPAGFKVADDGTSCEDIDECQFELCAQGCNNTIGSYTCYCYAGYTLAADNLDCTICPDNFYGDGCKQRCECRGRSLGCNHVKGCICNQYWTGTTCNEDVDECKSIVNPCAEGKICKNYLGGYTCECPTGYEESTSGTCVDINECDIESVSLCPQLCENNDGSYQCVCKDGYIYNSINNTCDDVDECTTGISICQQYCYNLVGSYNCECNPGHVLDSDRGTCLRVEDVCAAYPNNCSYACKVVGNQPQCYCETGYELDADQATCIDINECGDSELNKCTDPSTCTNIPGSYSCTCPTGQELQSDKRTCQACGDYYWGDNCANECACNPLGTTTCDPVTGCVCGTGWQGDKCETDIDECDTNTNNCPSTATCVNTQGSFSCQCNTGFEDLNNQCVDINECLSNPCDQTCQNTVGSYICSCTEGFSTIGDNCVDIDECLNPELYDCDQICRNQIGRYACECFDGFKLNTTSRNTCISLNVNKTECTVKVCSDTCIIVDNVETCLCPNGFELDSTQLNCTDIDECSTNPCKGGTCNNNDGGFTCSCEDGFKLAADKVTCEECTTGFYGSECGQACACNASTTASCSKINGTCNCVPGWEGIECDTDTDECVAQSIVCGSNAQCVNTPGSYKCACDIGYVRSRDGECVACDSTSYGLDCSETCACIYQNTQECNDTNGACTCKPTWTGAICDTDVNECDLDPNYCPDKLEYCNNLNGSVECRCVTGYSRPNVGASCQECSSSRYGDDCLQTCPCVMANTADCNNVNGNCTCKSGWTGNTCAEDIDECTTTPNYCPDALEYCSNLNGSAECKCVTGYYRPTSGDACTDINECLDAALNNCTLDELCSNLNGSYECIAGMANYTVRIILDLDVDPKVFDSSTPEFRALRDLIEGAGTAFGKNAVGGQVRRVSINSFEIDGNGSVVAIGVIQVDTALTNTSEGDAVSFALKLANQGSLTLNGTTVTVNGVSFSTSGLITGDTTVCELFDLLTTCTGNETCVEIDGTAQCSTPTESSTKDSDTDLIIGLAVGIPLFLLLTLLIAICCCMIVRRRRSERSPSDIHSADRQIQYDNRDAPFRSVFATHVVTKGSWGAPGRWQMYSPDQYSEAATSESSGEGRLLKGRGRGRSDFQDSPWYDNRGATPRDPGPSTSAVPEAAGPTSNFSWEYMFRMLEPHREFEIRRPNVTPSVNPMYTPRRLGIPDSMA